MLRNPILNFINRSIQRCIITTIAYKNGIIAYDSLLTSDITITSNNYNKSRLVNGIKFFLAGSISDYDRFTALYFDEKSEDELNISAIIVDSGKVYLSSTNKEGKLWKSDITGIPYAIGTGEDHALTAMDLGLSARDAVKMAIKRDTCTGGRIRTFKIKSV